MKLPTLTCILLAGVFLVTGSAQALVPGSDAPVRKKKHPPAAAPVLAPQATPPAATLDFDLLGQAAPVQQSEALMDLQRRAQRRRTMLNLHQVFGLSTLALLGATVAVGEVSFQDRFSRNAPGTGRYQQAHEVLAISTLAGFAATAGLALFAPVPYEKESHVDTAFFHKLMMGGAALGMLSEAGFGFWAATREGYTNQPQLAQIHRIIGFTSLALMVSGAGVWVF